MTLPRTRRLQLDFDEISTVFSENPYISFDYETTVFPPENYVFTFNVPALVVTPERYLVKAKSARVSITLPSRYPAERPLANAIDDIYHPNFGTNICVFDGWSPASNITDFIITIGRMIQWEIADPKSAYNGHAAIAYVSKSQAHPLPGFVNLGASIKQNKRKI